MFSNVIEALVREPWNSSRLARSPSSTCTDEQIVARVLGGETELFEVIVRRRSWKLYRVAISVVRNDSDAEDIVQDTFCSAYQHLAQFAGRANFTTWLARKAK